LVEDNQTLLQDLYHAAVRAGRHGLPLDAEVRRFVLARDESLPAEERQWGSWVPGGEAHWAADSDPPGDGPRLARPVQQQQQQQQPQQHHHPQQSPDRVCLGAASSAESQRAARALEEARTRCSSFFGDLEAMARRVRPNSAGPVLEERLTEGQWDALDALAEAVTRASALDVPVDDGVISLLDAAGYEDADDGSSSGSRHPESEGAHRDE